MLPEKQLYTIDDIYALPEGTRAELIDGIIYNMAPPNRYHQALVSFLIQAIGNYISQTAGGCEVYAAPFAVFLNSDTHTYVEPDISVICDKNKLDSKGCNGAPDWIIEIVSPSSRRMDYYIKLFKYRTAGVREYWIIDPERQLITVYNFQEEFMETYSLNDKIRAGIYLDLYIDFSKRRPE